MAFKNKTEEDLVLIQSKIYLYLAYHYMDLHHYERVVDYVERCRYLYIDREESPTSLHVIGNKCNY